MSVLSDMCIYPSALVCVHNFSNPKWQVREIKLKSESQSSRGWGRSWATGINASVHVCEVGLCVAIIDHFVVFPKSLRSKCLYSTYAAGFSSAIARIRLFMDASDLELHAALPLCPWPGRIFQWLTWECWVVTGELLKTLAPHPDPCFLPSASEYSTPVYTTVEPTFPARAQQTDRKGTTGKASLFTGVGPVDESGIPVAIRSVGHCFHDMIFICLNSFVFIVGTVLFKYSQ